MEVYIEYVIIDNLVIDSLILLCVKSTLKLRSSWWRILLSAVLGTIIAVILPIFNLNQWFQLPIKLVLGLIMVFMLAKYTRFKDYLFSFLLFIAYTFLLVGACIVTLLIFNTDLDLLAAGGYDIALPLGIIFLIVTFYVSLIISIAKYLSRRRVMSPYVKKVVLCLAEHRLNLDAFVDTGNKLVDKTSGMPVIILGLDTLLKYFSKEEVENLMQENGKGSKVFKGVHQTQYNTISGEAKKMTIFEADKIVINTPDGEYTTNKFVVGVTYKKFKDAISYQMLLNPFMM